MATVPGAAFIQNNNNNNKIPQSGSWWDGGYEGHGRERSPTAGSLGGRRARVGAGGAAAGARLLNPLPAETFRLVWAFRVCVILIPSGVERPPA